MCNAALQPACDRREKERKKYRLRKQKGNVRLSICLGFSSISQVSSQVRLPCPSLPVPFPTGAKWTGTCITNERDARRTGVWVLGGGASGQRRIRVANVAGDLILVRINSVVPKEVTGANQGTTRQMILQYSTADVKERARDGARVLPVYMGKARGGSVDEASLSSRQDHHHRDHRAGPPVVCPGLSLSLCAEGGYVYITIWCRGRTRGRAAKHAPK